MPTAAQIEIVQDLKADGKRVTLVPPRSAPSFVSGSAGAASGSPSIQTWMIAKSYSAQRVDGSSITARDSLMLVAAGAFADDVVPGPGWSALVSVLPAATFPVQGAPGVQLFEVVRIDKVTWEGEVPLLYFLQVRT